MDYDVLILGGGIIGCAVAYDLSKYNLNIALIEKDYDIADDIAFSNTAIVHDGTETSNDFMAALEVLGNSLIEKVADKFNIPFKRIGTLRVGETQEEINKINRMYNRAKERGIKNIYLLNREEVLEIEPNLKDSSKIGLYSKNTAIISPYDLAISYAEVASDNGVNFRLEEEVIDIKKSPKGFNVTTNKNKFTCKFVINTIPGELNIEEKLVEIEKERNLYYLLVDNRNLESLSNLVIRVFDDRSFVMSVPTFNNNNTLIGIKSNDSLEFKKRIEVIKKLDPEIDNKIVSHIYNDEYNKDVMIIDDSNIANGEIRVTGNHYGEITIAPTLAQMICETIVNNLKCSQKKNFIDKRRDVYRFRDMSKEERNEIIALDKRYGNIVCICSNVSEGEIVDAIRRPLGARTIEGVKRRTGAMMGGCDGSYCLNKIINILARELDKKPTEIVQDSKNSKVLASRIKEFNEV